MSDDSSLDDFTLDNSPEIPLISHEDYYSSAFSTPNTLVLPDSLSQSLELIERLPIADRKRFLRAAQWMQAANGLWEYHTSSHYIALTVAIEALIPSEATRASPTCGKDKALGVTKLFQKFVERYTPRSEANEKKLLYRIRSDLAHGRYTFSIDESPWLSFSTSYLKDHKATTELSRTVQQVLVNWLRKK